MKTTGHFLLGLIGLVVFPTGCGSAEPSDLLGTEQQAQDKTWVVFANPFGNGAPNPTEGVTGFVHSDETGDGRTHVTLHVNGLPPNREFGSHVHLLPCAQNQAGGHYRNDPAGSATPENEIWLDFTTNAAGNGEAQAIADFLIRPDGANAVIIHDHGTDPATGVAGPKLACKDHDF